ncbi:glycosyl hydrolase family 28-related protein [Flavisolibacter ginsenosidimutans]|nr:glycosyl hydrolase family 28-related protein [Flavisolibacter ginsenosidimutans]
MVRFFFCLLFIGLSIVFSIGCSRKNGIEDKQNPPADSSKTKIYLNVVSVGAVGNGTADDTWAFQKAIDSVAALGGGTVYVPTGTYLIDADVSINMKSNVTLDMVDTTRVLKTKPTATVRNYVIKLNNISNAKVIAGKIVGDRYQHLGTTGEWGMGMGINSSSSITVTGTHIVDCWGDGITISSYNCVLKNVVCDNNRRQGLTIGSSDSLLVDSCTFTHTNGTAPQDGIDIEPDAGTAQRVHITNCLIAYNTKVGVEMNAKPTTTAVIKNIYVQNNFIHDNSYSGYVQYLSNSVFTDNRMISNTYSGNRVHASNAINCLFDPNTYQ